jgi:hypothetical protein
MPTAHAASPPPARSGPHPQRPARWSVTSLRLALRLALSLALLVVPSTPPARADAGGPLSPSRVGLTLELPRATLDGTSRGGLGVGVEVDWSASRAQILLRFRHVAVGLLPAAPRTETSGRSLDYAVDMAALELGGGLSLPLWPGVLELGLALYGGVQSWEGPGRADRSGGVFGGEASISLAQLLDLGARLESSDAGMVGPVRTFFLRADLPLLVASLLGARR